MPNNVKIEKIWEKIFVKNVIKYIKFNLELVKFKFVSVNYFIVPIQHLKKFNLTLNTQNNLNLSNLY